MSQSHTQLNPSRDEFQTKTLQIYGPDFSNYFHHYSECLFLDASKNLSGDSLAIDAGSYFGDNAFAMAKKLWRRRTSSHFRA